MPADARPEDPGLARFLRDELGDAGVAVADQQWDYVGPIWLWRGAHADGTPTKAAWYFLTIAADAARAIRAAGPAAATGRRKGFGSLRITATIGATTWQSSLFPHRESGGYILPVKASVRKREGIDEGSVVTVRISRDS